MPTLNWIGKRAVENHHASVQMRLLHCDRKLSHGDPHFDLEPGTGNLLVEGDNLQALKALLPFYAGRVKCIYIDPPYNTGNENWVYNDNVNAPEIQKWLKATVDRDDLSRHDKWLCMMYPRLRLLRDFLREDGSIFISIDDNEVSNLRQVMDEIFGGANFVATVIWQKVFAPKNSARHLSDSHDYVVIYARNAEIWKPNLLARGSTQDDRYKNPDKDVRGPWTSGDLTARNYYSLGKYPITCPSGRIVEGPPRGRYWAVSKKTFDEMNTDNRIWWGKDGNGMPRFKRFLSEVQDGIVPQTIWFHQEVGHTQEAKKEIVALLPEGNDVFITPKPSRLIERILQMATDPGDIILDSFAGSGTTGHAVLKMNAADGGDRRFVLVEMEPNVARPITRERLIRAIDGYGDTEGLGGGFRFCTLGEPMLSAEGYLDAKATWADLAHFVFLRETGSALERSKMDEASGRVGTANGVIIYLFWEKGVAGVLDRKTLLQLKKHKGVKVVYGGQCKVGEAALRSANVVFRQIPYEVAR